MVPTDAQFSGSGPLPDDEQERLDAVRRYGAFGLLRSAAFDDIARLTAFICRTPASMISLIDSTQQWFLAQSGISSCGTSREVSFCAHALIGNEMLIVEDTHSDARFSRNPLVVGEPFVRFYAGAPLLTTDGYALGTLCVIDYVPRVLDAEQRDTLRSLSRMVMTQLECGRLKREMGTLKQSLAVRPARK